MVDVDQDDRELVAVTGGTVEFRVEPGEEGLPVQDTGEKVHRRHRPGLGHPLGESAEARPEAGVADSRRPDQVAGIGGVHEPVGQPGEAARLTPADDDRVARGSHDGAQDTPPRRRR